MKDLSILVPSRNEMFLKNTVEDILKNIEADTEVIVLLDGQWATPPITQHERVNVIYVPEAVGQRAGANLACKLSRAKYVMKVDAHCKFDKGFDRKMVEAFQRAGDNVTMVPIMRNLWAFDWKCRRCGWKKYQSPTPKRCESCHDSRYIVRKMRWAIKTTKEDTAYKQWKGKHAPANFSYCFDSEPHFQYFAEVKRRPDFQKDKAATGLTETMSLQGSAFMLTREKYWELNICDESVGSWGNQGIETACKTWLSGGRVLCNHNTWYAHLFRTQGGDFGFPYEQHGKEVDQTKKKVWGFFFGGWEKQIHPVSWLVEKFWPIEGWSEESLKKLKERESGKIT